MEKYIYKINPTTKIILDTGVRVTSSEAKRLGLEKFTTGEYVISDTNIKTLSEYVGVVDADKGLLYMYKAASISSVPWTPDPVYGPDQDAELAEEILAISENREPNPVPDIIIETFPEQNVDEGSIIDRTEAEKVVDLIAFYKLFLQKDGYAKGNVLITPAIALNIVAGANYTTTHNLDSGKLTATIEAFRAEYYRLEALLDSATTIAACDDIKDNQTNWPTAVVSPP